MVIVLHAASVSPCISNHIFTLQAYRAGLNGDGYVWINDYSGGVYSNFWDAPAISGSDCTRDEWVKGLENQFVAVRDGAVDQTQPTVLQKVLQRTKLCI